MAERAPGPAGLLRQTVSDFGEDDAIHLAAALAFYTVLSLAPLVLIVLGIAGLVGPGVREELAAQISATLGPQAGSAISQIAHGSAQAPRAGLASSIIGTVTLILSAAGVFGQLQASLNKIWDVKAKPGFNIWLWLRKRFLSVSMLLGVGFLLLISLGISTAINLLFSGEGVGWEVVNTVASVLITTLLFALMFKFLPDAKIGWRDVWVGALLTAALFAVGKAGIGAYLGRSAVGSQYGAAGSLIVVLLWVYYGSIILFFGAELTQVYAARQGSRIVPAEHAVPEEGKGGGAASPKAVRRQPERQRRSPSPQPDQVLTAEACRTDTPFVFAPVKGPLPGYVARFLIKRFWVTLMVQRAPKVAPVDVTAPRSGRGVLQNRSH